MTMWHMSMTQDEKTRKITRTFNWLTNTDNHGVMMKLYAKDQGFKILLDGLLKEVVLKRDNKLWVMEWFDSIQDVFGGCVGRPSRLEMGLHAFRARHGTKLTKKENDLIFVLDVILEVNGILLESAPSQSYSSDVQEATSSLFAGDNEGQGLV